MRHSKTKQKLLVQSYLANKNNNSPLVGNYIAYFDGACEPRNPGGNMEIGATIKKDGHEYFRHSDFVKESRNNSNNVAEYMAFESILDFVIKNNWTNQHLTIYGDSKLVIEQMFGTWRMKGGLYIPFAKRCIEKLHAIRQYKNLVNGIWIRREQNGYADELSKSQLINNGVEFKIQPLAINPSK